MCIVEAEERIKANNPTAKRGKCHVEFKAELLAATFYIQWEVSCLSHLCGEKSSSLQNTADEWDTVQWCRD